jgi:hypothetical protein
VFPSAAPAAPAPAPAANDPAKAGRTLTPDEASQWRNRIAAALEATKPAIEDGKKNVSRYTGKYLDTTPLADECLVPTDFYFVEAKRSRLFYRLPDVFVKPEKPGLEDAAVVFQAALNKRLGAQGVNILPAVKQVIFDVLCPTGFGAISLGFQTVVHPEQPTVPVQVGTEPDMEAAQPGSVLGLQPPMKPIFVDAPNIVARWYFGERLKPGDLIVPPDFCDLDFDKAAYLGQRFKEDVPEDAPGGNTKDDDRRLTPLPSGAQSAQRKQRTGHEIWYRAHLFDADVQHPDKIRTFKIYDDDREAPVVVRDHPHQVYKSPAGELLKGMRGYPIAPLTLRYVSDTWMVPSDCSMARNTADELSKGRTQMLRSRDRNLPQWGFDATAVDKDIQGKIEKNEIQGGIPFNRPGQDLTWPIQKGNAPKETYTFNEVAQQDLQKIWRMGQNQMGVLDDKSRTATEQQIAAGASQEADEADRAVVLTWYVEKVATKIAALMQLYADEQEFVELVGADAQRLKNIPPEIAQQAQQAGQDARVLVPWNKELIEGLYSFSAKPNSQLFIDAAQEKKQLMDLYSFFANEPTINRAELTRAILSRYGFDPSKMLQQPPPKQAAPPNVALSIKGEDFNPQMPQSPIVLDALSKLGIPIDMGAVQAAQALAAQLTADQITAEGLAATTPQTEHGGKTAEAEPLSKHHAELTGGMQGTGQPAPLGAAGRAA